MTERIYCSEAARAAAAPLQGSAIHVDLWLGVEYPRAWKAKALQDNDLPAPVRQALDALPAAVAQAAGRRLRVQFIKQAASSDAAGLRLLLADCAEGNVRLQMATFEHYRDLTDLVAADLIDHQLPGGEPVDEAHYLVCTNGQRDVCCARFGLPLYEALRAEFGQRVWQTTHVGGHRYAPNLLCLPAGIMYGFVMPDEGVQVVQGFERQLLSLRHLRGRTCHPPVVQAAEYFLREAEGQHANAAYRFEGLSESGDIAHVSFVDAQQTRHQLDVRWTRNADTVLASCDDEPKPVDRFELVGATVAG